MDIIKDWIYRHKLFFISIIAFVLIKVAWVVWGCWSIGSQLKEKNDILQRKNWLVDKIVVEPRPLLIGTAISRRMGIVFLLYVFKSSF